jgi:hypothetical protein
MTLAMLRLTSYKRIKTNNILMRIFQFSSVFSDKITKIIIFLVNAI